MLQMSQEKTLDLDQQKLLLLNKALTYMDRDKIIFHIRRPILATLPNHGLSWKLEDGKFNLCAFDLPHLDYSRSSSWFPQLKVQFPKLAPYLTTGYDSGSYTFLRCSKEVPIEILRAEARTSSQTLQDHCVDVINACSFFSYEAREKKYNLTALPTDLKEKIVHIPIIDTPYRKLNLEFRQFLSEQTEVLRNKIQRQPSIETYWDRIMTDKEKNYYWRNYQNPPQPNPPKNCICM